MQLPSFLVLSALTFSAVAAPVGTLSIHILNQQTGLPSENMVVELERQEGSAWQHIATAKTDADGRIKSFYPQKDDFQPGVYRVTFMTDDYFTRQHLKTFFPSVPVIFSVTRKNEKLHIPLILSQYGYSTYRGG